MMDKTIDSLSKRLGIQAPKVQRKTNELLRLVDLKCTSGTLKNVNLTSMCKVVICLEMAANIFDLPLDKKDVIKLSGVKKTIYLNIYQILERILDVQTKITVDFICVKLGCTSVAKMAESILKRYEEHLYNTFSKIRHSEIDIRQPVFAAAAVYLSCNKMKVKINKTKLIDISRVSRTVFTNTLTLFEKFASTNSEVTKTATKRKAKSLLELVSEKIHADEGNVNTGETASTYEEHVQNSSTDYDEWRNKILNS